MVASLFERLKKKKTMGCNILTRPILIIYIFFSAITLFFVTKDNIFHVLFFLHFYFIFKKVDGNNVYLFFFGYGNNVLSLS
jgi:hypothetical protein